MKASGNERYEPLYREIEKKYTRSERENRKLKGKVENLEKQLADAEEKMRAEQEKVKKLNQLLFARQEPHPRTARTHAPVLRTPASYNRPQPDYVTDEQTLVMDACPSCATSLGAPISSRTRITEDIVIRPEVVVTSWTMNRYWCRGCHKQVESTVPGILPKSHFGPSVLTMTVTAKYRWNMPYAKIRDYLNLSFGLNISEGEVAHLLATAARLAGPKWAEIVGAVKAGRKVHCDETSWYIDGQKAWTHVFATDEAVLYDIADTRGKGIAIRALGPNFSGVRVSDCLGNYKNLPGRHQICWAHLTREAGENLERRPKNRERKMLSRHLDQIYTQLRDVTGKAEWDTVEAARSRTWCEQRAQDLRQRTWKDERSRLLVKRLGDFEQALFTCLDEPGIPPDNNAAERALRKFAVQRKISGGNRSPAHAQVHAKMMSVVETLRLEGDDFLTSLQRVLQAGMVAQVSGE